jgi:arginine utilization regulatory protein
LEHAIEGAMNLIDDGQIGMEQLPWQIVQSLPSKGSDVTMLTLPQGVRPLRETMEVVEQELIRQAMEQTDGNIQQAAKLLQVPRQTLQYRLSRQGK